MARYDRSREPRAGQLRLRRGPRTIPETELQPIDAFGRGAQNAQFGAQLASALAQAYGAYRDRKKQRTTQDALTEAIVASRAPSGWVNRDFGREPGFAQLPSSDVTRGAIPADMRRLGAETAAVASGGRYDPTGGPVVPITPFRPEDAILEDDTQIRGRESILNALLTDERLRDLGPEDITLAQKMTLDDLIQRKPRILTANELEQSGYAPGTVVQELPGGGHNVIQEPTKPGETFRQVSAKRLHEENPDDFGAKWAKENQGTMWNINETTREMKKVGGGGQTFNFPGPGGPVSTAHQLINDEFTERKEASATAESLLNSVDSLEALLETGFEPGPGEEWKQRARNIAIFLGMSDAEIETKTAQHQTFRAFANNVVLPRVKELGARPTDKDLQFIIDASPQLGNTIAGNRLILKSLRIMAEKRENEAQAWMDFLDITKDSTDPLYKKEWEKYAIASSTDVTNKRGSNWDHTGNARLMSFWNKYRKLRADQFQEVQKDRIGTLRQAIEKVNTLETDGLSVEIIDSTLRDSGLILPIPTRQ